MAGDTKTTGPAELPNPYAGDPFPGIQSTLDAIRDELRGSIAEGPTIMRIDAGAVSQSQHIRFRISRIVFSPDTAGAVVLTISTTQYPFTLPGFPSDIAFPIVIERGADISISGDGRCYLIGVAE